MSVRTLLAFIVGLLAASPSAFAINLIANPEFSGNIDGWTVVPDGGTNGYESYLGSPSGGSLRLEADTNHSASAQQCVDVHRWVSIDVVLRQIKLSEYGSGNHTFKLDVFDAPDCAGSILTTVAPPDTGVTVISFGYPWIEESVYDTLLPVGSLSAKFTLRVAGGVAVSSHSGFLIDDVRVGPLDEIFIDPFEPE